MTDPAKLKYRPCPSGICCAAPCDVLCGKNIEAGGFWVDLPALTDVTCPQSACADYEGTYDMSPPFIFAGPCIVSKRITAHCQSTVGLDIITVQLFVTSFPGPGCDLLVFVEGVSVRSLLYRLVLSEPVSAFNHTVPYNNLTSSGPLFCSGVGTEVLVYE